MSIDYVWQPYGNQMATDDNFRPSDGDLLFTGCQMVSNQSSIMQWPRNDHMTAKWQPY